MTEDYASPRPIGSSGPSKPIVRQDPASSVVQGEALKAPNAGPLASQRQSKSTAPTDAARPIESTSDLAAFSSDELKDQSARVIGSAKDLASKAGEKVQDQLAAHKSTGADFIGNIASAMQRAAKEVEKDVPFAAAYITKAADRLGDISNSARDGNFSDLAREAQALARRQPFESHSSGRIWRRQILKNLRSD